MTTNTDTPTACENGSLKQDAALAALGAAARAATSALPAALLLCETRSQMRRVTEDRDLCQLAYTDALARTLKRTGPLFEQAAQELEKTAGEIEKRASAVKAAADAASLLADLARLSSKLALAFA